MTEVGAPSSASGVETSPSSGKPTSRFVLSHLKIVLRQLLLREVLHMPPRACFSEAHLLVVLCLSAGGNDDAFQATAKSLDSSLVSAVELCLDLHLGREPMQMSQSE